MLVSWRLSLPSLCVEAGMFYLLNKYNKEGETSAGHGRYTDVSTRLLPQQRFTLIRDIFLCIYDQHFTSENIFWEKAVFSLQIEFYCKELFLPNIVKKSVSNTDTIAENEKLKSDKM